MTTKPHARTVRLDAADSARVERVRASLTLDGVRLSEAAILTTAIRRGLASLELEIATTTTTTTTTTTAADDDAA